MNHEIEPEQHININHTDPNESNTNNHEIQEEEPHTNINQPSSSPSETTTQNHQIYQTLLNRTSSETTQQNIRDRWKLDSIKNGIIVLCSLFASFCFEAILNPPGGVWQDSQTTTQFFINTTIATQISKQSIHDKRARAFVRISQLGAKIPKLNLTNAELFSQGKAMNIVMYPREFLTFLGWNSLCYLTSLSTVVLVMLTTSFESFFPGGLVLIMTGLVVVSAVNLYWSVLVLVSDKEFGYWAFAVGGSPLRVACYLFSVYQIVKCRLELMKTVVGIFRMVKKIIQRTF